MPVDGRPCGTGAPKIAIVSIDGPMLNQALASASGENPVALFGEKLDAVAATPGLSAVVLRINSAGGSVTATEIMCGQLRRFKAKTGLPVIACLMDVGAGGAYYLATGADLILAHPTTITGGIGVIINLYNLQEAMATLNVLSQPIKSGKNIDMGTTLESLSPDAEALLQQLADDFHRRFVTAVEDSRPQLAAAGRGMVFDGRILSGTQALDLGLIDRLGDLQDAIDAAASSVPHEDPSLVFFGRKEQRARSIYATPTGGQMLKGVIPFSLPGLAQSELPLFLYMWQPNPLSE